MDDQDPAIVLLQHFRQLIQGGLSDYTAYNAVKVAFPELCDIVRGRSLSVGAVPTVQIGDAFRYRFELMLAGLHNNSVRGICVGQYARATCVVAKYPLHNFHLAERSFIYGGEGGQLALAHSQNVRVLEDQQWTVGNIACFNAMDSASAVRTVIRRRRNDNSLRYVYEGLFRVTNCQHEISPENLIVYEFTLARVL